MNKKHIGYWIFFLLLIGFIFLSFLYPFTKKEVSTSSEKNTKKEPIVAERTYDFEDGERENLNKEDTLSLTIKELEENFNEREMRVRIEGAKTNYDHILFELNTDKEYETRFEQESKKGTNLELIDFYSIVGKSHKEKEQIEQIEFIHYNVRPFSKTYNNEEFSLLSSELFFVLSNKDMEATTKLKNEIALIHQEPLDRKIKENQQVQEGVFLYKNLLLYLNYNQIGASFSIAPIALYSEEILSHAISLEETTSKEEEVLID